VSEPGSIKLGALVWPQHTTWSELMAAGQAVDRLGFDALWVFDHLVPIAGRPVGPCFEPTMTLAGWAGLTSRVTLGLMVAANTFRNPAVLVKTITALDHMSAGRAVFGLGAGWFEPEHTAFGIDFGSSTGTRLDWLDEAAALVRPLLNGTSAAGIGRHYLATGAINDPPPVQAAIPLLIGGSGERKTLATVARYADAWNVGSDVDEARQRDGVLREWCDRVGRDEREIERTVGVGIVVIRDSVRDASRTATELRSRNGDFDDSVLLGPSSLVIERLAKFVELGFRTIHVDVPAPFDRETLERLAGEVGPALRLIDGRREGPSSSPNGHSGKTVIRPEASA
jgi:alkanesulfonate monooxygenase SsuD/methylene tetrahydromethanopterin reductase-like flavin-dependent oxidoreductase (luciferase family)